jgi:integrase/recombinase XerD
MNSSNLIESYIEYIRKLRNYSRTTLSTCNVVCRRWAEFLEDRGISDVKSARSEHVLAWIDKRMKKDGVCDRTIESELCTLRTFHEYLIHFHGPSSNPCGCLPEFICKPSLEQDYVSVDEIFLMLETFDTSNIFNFRSYVIIALLWSTGLRNTELRSLQWQDVDLEEATLFVKKGKGNIQRQLFLNDRILADLKEYRRQILAGPQTPVFCTYPNSKRSGVCDLSLSNKQLLDILKNAARQVGIKRRVTAQMLRHSFATHMYEAGVSVDDIGQMMGHAHRTETTRYIHVSVAAAQRLLNDHVFHNLHYREDT